MMRKSTARLCNVHGDMESAQDATVEREGLLSKKPRIKIFTQTISREKRKSRIRDVQKTYV